MHRIIRILLIALAVLVGVAVVGWGGLHWYLHSEAVRQQAGRELSKMVGAPVEVDDLTVGSQSSTARLRIFEPPSDDGPRHELLSVQSAETNLSLLDLALEHLLPRTLTLRGVHVTLRLDRQGKLLTKLPAFSSLSSQPTPAVQLVDGRVTIQQEGKPDFQLSGLSGNLKPEGQQFTLTGTAHDPIWGTWTLTGNGDMTTRTGSAQAETERLQVTDEPLKTLPLIPPVLWEHVDPEGPAAVRLQLTLGPAENIDLGGTLTLQGMRINVPELDAYVTGATGVVQLKDGVITVHDGKAYLAGGGVQMDATLRFQNSDPHLEAQVRCQGVELRKLPKSWSLPPQIEGQLKGKANLEVIYHQGTLETHGGGRGDVENATIAGQPAKVEMELHSDGKRFRFVSANP